MNQSLRVTPALRETEVEKKKRKSNFLLYQYRNIKLIKIQHVKKKKKNLSNKDI